MEICTGDHSCVILGSYLKGTSHHVFHVVYADDDSGDLEEWEVKNHWLGYD